MYIQWLPAQTQQINLKTFYPFIAYMFDFVRQLAPTQERNNARHSDPFIEGMFEKLGHHINPNPSASLHPALRHKILRAPIPRSRRATPTENITLLSLVRNMISKSQIYPAWRNYRRGGKDTNHWKVYKCSCMWFEKTPSLKSLSPSLFWYCQKYTQPTWPSCQVAQRAHVGSPADVSDWNTDTVPSVISAFVEGGSKARRIVSRPGPITIRKFLTNDCTRS